MMASSAALMYGGAGALSLFEAVLPGGPQIDLPPGIAALCCAIVLLLVGARLPILVLGALGPAGAALIAYGLATSGWAGDGAVLYMWPVLWEAYFFGRRGAILIVAWIALVQGLSLLSMPPGVGGFDRWLDVIVSVALVATVVELLGLRNRRLVARLAGEARVDKLTGLLNRRGFEEGAAVELARARRESSSVGIASFDIDHFKQVNDQHGHESGDRVLRRVGDVFRGEMRESDLLARMGGEEFVALLPGGGIIDAKAFAERVRGALDASQNLSAPRVTMSAGVAAATAPGLEQLMKMADLAMYDAKFAGRNRIVVNHRPR
jgi:diguanylate cyclase (GGDEF)-like protein